MKKIAYIIILAILIVSGWYAYSFYTKNNSSPPASITNNNENISPPLENIEPAPPSSAKENLDAINTSDLEKEMKSVDEELNNL